MAWNTIATSDVLNEFTPAEQSALQSIQGASIDLGAILTEAVNAMQGAVLAGGNQVGQPGTVPDQLRREVVAIARWNWLASFPTLKALQSDARKQAHDDAQKRLDDVSMRRIKTEIPAQPQKLQAPVNAVQIVRRGVRFSPESFEHIGST
jgi:hypothetical protein